MDEDFKVVLKVVACVAGIIATIALSITLGVYVSGKHDEAMAKLGYQQVMAPGHTSPVWVQCEKEGK